MPKELTINMKGDVAEFLLYDTIGEDKWFGGGVSAETFRRQLLGTKSKTAVIRINSPGGSSTEAMAMLKAMDDFPGRVEVDIEGMAASAATVVAMGGDVVRIADNALFMIHEAWTEHRGNASEMRKAAEVLEMVNGQILDAYSRKAKPKRDELARMMAEETWMGGREAVDQGFADKVTGSVAVAAFAEPARYCAKFGYKKGPEIPAASAEELAAHAKRVERLERLKVVA